MISRAESLARLRNSHREVEPDQRVVIDDFLPQDAEGIAALYYAVYAETFPIDYVYDPEAIRRGNACGDVHHVVARTGKGDVVGLCALFRNPPGRYIMEAGAWIVLPAYRDSTLAMFMVHRLNTSPPAHLELNAIFGQSVCDHVITQKLFNKCKAICCALELEAMPPRPDDETSWGGERISLLDGVILFKDSPQAVHLPDPYAEDLRQAYRSMGLSRSFLQDVGPQGPTRSVVQSLEAASLVKVSIEAPGADIAEHLARLEQAHPGRHVYQLVLPLWLPGVSFAVEAARRAGYFWGGLLPLWADKDALLLQKLATEPDYSRIQLFTSEARAILDRIRTDRAAVGGWG